MTIIEEILTICKSASQLHSKIHLTILDK